jgi:hypothetical protein
MEHIECDEGRRCDHRRASGDLGRRTREPPPQRGEVGLADDAEADELAVEQCLTPDEEIGEAREFGELAGAVAPGPRAHFPLSAMVDADERSIRPT